MARILWLGDAGSHTGFARVTHAIGERLVEDYGHDISVLAPNYRGDFWPGLRDPGRQPLKLYTTYGPHSGTDIYGAKRIVELILRIQPEVVVTLNDPWVFLMLLGNNIADPDRVLLRAQPHIYYVPCDGTNLPPQWTELVPQVARVFAMSKWGQQHYEGSTLAYHGLDQDQWWPVEERPITTSDGRTLRTKAECKQAFGYDPGDFLIGRVDTNSGRKDYAATWKAVVPLMKRHKHVKAHFHVSNRENPGVDFVQLFSREPDLEDRFFVPSMKHDFQGWPQRDMNALVNAFDVVVNTSRGEGYGFSNQEALACGVPVIAQNVSAIPEVVGPGGILIEPQRLITVPNGEDNWLADIPAFTEALQTLYDSPSKRQDLGRKGVEHVRTSFSWDATTALFHEAIEEDAARYRELLAEAEAERAARTEGVTA